MKNFISTDSLTDIVSNSVGILIIFAVINLIHDQDKTYQLEIPIEHVTELSPVFFIAQNDKILHLDVDLLFANAAIQATRGAARAENLFNLEYFGVYGKIDQNKGISFLANDTDEWDGFSEIENTQTNINKALQKIDNTKQFAFFFVDDSSDGNIAGSGFESFRVARDYLKTKNIKSGWQPVNENAPANICDRSFSPRCVYRPSYLGSNN